MNAQVKSLNAAELTQFTGTFHWYQHGLTNATYTDGVRFVAARAGAYWLIDAICSAQSLRVVSAEEFQCWRLIVQDTKKAELVMDDGDGNVRYRQLISFTDFPMPEIKMYFTNNVLLLPSEY